MIVTKRVYDHTRNQGKGFLVERLWPRGMKKQDLHYDAWLKDVAPSSELRKWFSHDPSKYREFVRRYHTELDSNPETWAPILDAAQEGTVTLLYSAHDTEHNNAVALQQYLEPKIRPRR